MKNIETKNSQVEIFFSKQIYEKSAIQQNCPWPSQEINFPDVYLTYVLPCFPDLMRTL